MKNKFIFVCLLVMTVFLSACGKKEAEPTMPEGVYTRGEKEYYVIMLPEGKSVWDCFYLNGDSTTRGTVVVNQYFDTSSSAHSGVIYNSTVVGGGWVAYDESESGKIIFIPDHFDIDEVKLICGRLARNPESYMTLEEAKEYISGMK